MKKFTKDFLKRIFILSVLFCAAVPLFAVEEYVSVIYKKIDTAFDERSDEQLHEILSGNQGDKYYFLMENYAIKKVRRLIIVSDYEFAMDADLVIIDNNLDNVDAVELYATISDAFENQKQAELLAIEKRQQEIARVEALKAGQKANAEKNYNTVKTSSGNTVYVTGKDGGQLSYSDWKLYVGLNPMLLTNTGDDLSKFMFGLAMNGGYAYQMNVLALGFDLEGSFKFLGADLNGKDESMFGEIFVVPKLAFRGLSDRVFLRAGFGMLGRFYGTSSSTAASSDLQDNMFTPVIGVMLDEIPAGNFGLSFGYDYYLGHLWTDGLKSAMAVTGSISIPFAQMERVKLNFNIGVKDVLFLKDSGIENKVNLILSLGARNVVR